MAPPAPHLDPRNWCALTLAAVSSSIAPFAAYTALAGWFYILPPLLFAAGLYLLIHYWVASARRPPRRRHRGFWIISATFNGLLAFTTIALLSSALYQGSNPASLLPWIPLALWQFTALVLSLAARRHDHQLARA